MAPADVHIELVDKLRCPRAHEPTWLVASIERALDRDILEGTLGCPACSTRFPVSRGVADLRLPEERPARAVRPVATRSDEEAIRCAAFLDLAEPGGFVVLAGEWAELAPALVRLVDGVHALAVNSPVELVGVAGVSCLLAGEGVPVRESATRGVALDATHATPMHMEAAGSALRPGGRLVAPAAAALPLQLTLLARDEAWLVAERPQGVSAPVSLGRAGR